MFKRHKLPEGEPSLEIGDLSISDRLVLEVDRSAANLPDEGGDGE